MYLIRELSGEQEFRAFADIIADAYPGFNFDPEEEKRDFIQRAMKAQEENPYLKYFGAFDDNNNLLGGMRFHYYTMKLLSKKIKCGGVGLVAVHFLHKKEKIAKEIITYFIEYFRNQGAPMVILYPFRPDFYKKMGFGFGTSMNQYTVKPCDLPRGGSKTNIVYIKENEALKLLECYREFYERTNGLIEKYENDFTSIFKNPKSRIAAYKKDDKVKGYMVYEFKSGSERNSMINDIVVKDMMFENTEALYGLMAFLNSQNDQIRHVILNTLDEDFRFLLDNPRNASDNMFAPVYHECSIQGTGLMYRASDVKSLFKELRGHNFNNESCRMKLSIRDSLIKENDGSIILNFEKGLVSIIEDMDYEVEISLDIADLSSLITCAVSFKTLYKYGKASISKVDYLEKINRIFASDEKPICSTLF